jgi:hypothetical protein
MSTQLFTPGQANSSRKRSYVRNLAGRKLTEWRILLIAEQNGIFVAEVTVQCAARQRAEAHQLQQVNPRCIKDDKRWAPFTALLFSHAVRLPPNLTPDDEKPVRRKDCSAGSLPRR